VPEFGDETSLATEAKEPAPTQKIEEPAAMPKTDNTGVGVTKISEITSPSAEMTVPKAQKDLIATPRGKGWSMY
jgi:hypothetical protein